MLVGPDGSHNPLHDSGGDSMKNHSAEMLRKKREDQRRYQQGFYTPPKKRIHYGAEYEPEADDMSWWAKCLLGIAIAGAVVLCMALYPKSSNEVKSEQVQSQAN